MNTQEKERVLIVAPYGIGVRDLVLNDVLGPYLTERYEVDLLSPFEFDDPSDWGLSKTFQIKPKGFINRLLSIVNHRAASSRWLLAYRRFYLETGWPNIYEMQQWTHAFRPVESISYDKWGKFNRGPWGAIFRRLVSPFPLMYPNAKILDSGNYKAIFVVHPANGECSIMANAAAKKGIPVIALAMGMDNLMSLGPILMKPDLFLLWGEDQLDSFANHHLKFNPKLASTRPVAIGGLGHDRFINGNGVAAFEAKYPEIAPTARVITYATYSEAWYPRQAQTCQAILDVLERDGVDAHLIVRRRPIGADNEMWDEFARDNPGRVTIQAPEGVSFTKSGSRRANTRASEIAEIELFAATLRRSSLVVTGGFSTVYLDAHASGTPSAVVALPPVGEIGPTYTMVNCVAYGKDIPSMGMVEYIDTYERLSALVTKVIARDDAADTVRENETVYGLQAGERDGKAGERAVAAIKELLG